MTALDTDIREMIGRANEQYQLLMTALTDVAKDGPRLFSFTPGETGFFDKPNWIERKFILTLWCEHSKLPLNHPDLNGSDSKKGVYEVTLTREWLKKSAPILKVLSTTLSLALPIAASGAKLAMDDTSYGSIEEQLDFGNDCADSFLDGSEQVGGWLTTADETDLESTRAVRAHGATEIARSSKG